MARLIDPPPEDLDVLGILQQMRSSLGFKTTEETLTVVEALFGKSGRVQNTIKFMRTLLMML
jgi:hypothetical protein